MIKLGQSAYEMEMTLRVLAAFERDERNNAVILNSSEKKPPVVAFFGRPLEGGKNAE